jgi:hypothetical protein
VDSLVREISQGSHVKSPHQFEFNDVGVPTFRGRHFLMPSAISNLFQASDAKAEADRQTVLARIALYRAQKGKVHFVNK